MLAGVVLALLIAAVLSQYEFMAPRDIPSYVQRGLQQKDRFRPLPREKKRTISNLTLQEVFEKIKEITRALNQHAKKNGYFVDYKFRILESN